MPKTPEEAKNRSRSYSTDMSPEDVARRINLVSELRAMAVKLDKAKVLGPVEPKKERHDP